MNNELAEKWSSLAEPEDVVLLSPPFTWPMLASVGLSLFQSSLNEDGVSSKILYPMFPMSYLMGGKNGQIVHTMSRNTIYEEFLFSHLTGMPNTHTAEEAVRSVYHDISEEELMTYVEAINAGRRAAEITVEATVERIIRMKPKVLLCSAIFAQINASIAICRRVKERAPEIITMIGGYVTGEIGIRLGTDHTCFDYISFGEGDETVPKAVRILLGREDGPMPEGIVHREKLGQLNEAPYPMTMDLNTAAIPCYDDYFEEVERMKDGFYGTDSLIQPNTAIYLEGSRGCWWGQKHPCSFCGLNGLKNIYRQKDTARIYKEIHETALKYPDSDIQLTDCIIDAKFMNDVLPKMAGDSIPYTVFAEVKSNLRDEELILLKNAGVTNLQPGIESLNDHLLTLMGKGNTAINHVYLLKMCEKHGLACYWNMLFGVPGETEADYEDLLDLVPQITHLQPPGATTRIQFQRFSRYLEHPQEFNLILKPWNGSEFMFGNDAQRQKELTLYYEETGEFSKTYRSHIPLYRKLEEADEKWKKQYVSSRRPVCEYTDDGETITITDTRQVRGNDLRRIALSGPESEIYRLLETPHSLAALKKKLAGRDEAEIDGILSALEEEVLIVKRSDKLLALAVKRD